MIYDKEKHDAAIVLTSIRHPGKWGVELSTRGRHVRYAGNLKATSDTLRTAALLNGLAAIRQLPASNNRVLVASDNRNFVTALWHRDFSKLVMANSLKATLAETVKEFDITVENTSKKLSIAMGTWLFHSVLDLVPAFPVAFVSQVV
jgi:ribonuclease HI